MAPAFSVIITTHNRAALLSRAIRSAKNQDAGGVQVIVVSDMVCAETHKVCSILLDDQDVFIQRAGQPGPGASRNMALSLVTGDHILFLDDDDALSDHFLKSARLHVGPDAIVYSDYTVVYERIEDNALRPFAAENRSLMGHSVADMYLKNFIPFSCLLFPRVGLEGVLFDTTLILNEDWDFILAAMARLPLQHMAMQGPVIYTRDIADNRGRSNNHLLEETYRTIYRNRPAPSAEHKRARQGFFATVGLSADLADL